MPEQPLDESDDEYTGSDDDGCNESPSEQQLTEEHQLVGGEIVGSPIPVLGDVREPEPAEVHAGDPDITPVRKWTWFQSWFGTRRWLERKEARRKDRILERFVTYARHNHLLQAVDNLCIHISARPGDPVPVEIIEDVFDRHLRSRLPGTTYYIAHPNGCSVTTVDEVPRLRKADDSFYNTGSYNKNIRELGIVRNLFCPDLPQNPTFVQRANHATIVLQNRFIDLSNGIRKDAYNVLSARKTIVSCEEILKYWENKYIEEHDKWYIPNSVLRSRARRDNPICARAASILEESKQFLALSIGQYKEKRKQLQRLQVKVHNSTRDLQRKLVRSLPDDLGHEKTHSAALLRKAENVTLGHEIQSKWQNHDLPDVNHRVQSSPDPENDFASVEDSVSVEGSVTASSSAAYGGSILEDPQIARIGRIMEGAFLSHTSIEPELSEGVDGTVTADNLDSLKSSICCDGELEAYEDRVLSLTDTVALLKQRIARSEYHNRIPLDFSRREADQFSWDYENFLKYIHDDIRIPRRGVNGFDYLDNEIEESQGKLNGILEKITTVNISETVQEVFRQEFSDYIFPEESQDIYKKLTEELREAQVVDWSRIVSILKGLKGSEIMPDSYGTKMRKVLNQVKLRLQSIFEAKVQLDEELRRIGELRRMRELYEVFRQSQNEFEKVLGVVGEYDRLMSIINGQIGAINEKIRTDFPGFDFEQSPDNYDFRLLELLKEKKELEILKKQYQNQFREYFTQIKDGTTEHTPNLTAICEQELQNASQTLVGIRRKIDDLHRRAEEKNSHLKRTAFQIEDHEIDKIEDLVFSEPETVPLLSVRIINEGAFREMHSQFISCAELFRWFDANWSDITCEMTYIVNKTKEVLENLASKAQNQMAEIDVNTIIENAFIGAFAEIDFAQCGRQIYEDLVNACKNSDWPRIQEVIKTLKETGIGEEYKKCLATALREVRLQTSTMYQTRQEFEQAGEKLENSSRLIFGHLQSFENYKSKIGNFEELIRFLEEQEQIIDKLHNQIRRERGIKKQKLEVLLQEYQKQRQERFEMLGIDTRAGVGAIREKFEVVANYFGGQKEGVDRAIELKQAAGLEVEKLDLRAYSIDDSEIEKAEELMFSSPLVVPWLSGKILSDAEFGEIREQYQSYAKYVSEYDKFSSDVADQVLRITSEFAQSIKILNKRKSGIDVQGEARYRSCP
jgi:hypothetical protein